LETLTKLARRRIICLSFALPNTFTPIIYI
jgi:hypothetical protein